MTQPDTMRAVVIDRFGGADELDLRTVTKPEVGAGDVLIKVEAAGVGSWDAVEREGAYDGVFGMPSTFPYILGWDGAGTIVATGPGVTKFSIGDRVYAASMPLPRGGFYAEYAVVPADHVSLIPQRLTVEQSGVLGWDALTALSGLEVLGLKADETLMVLGASGGIGHMAIQLARQFGVRVLAVASGDDGVALANRLGADMAIDGRRSDIAAAGRAFAPDGIDALLITTGGEVVERALDTLRHNGRAACPNGVEPAPKGRPGVPVSFYDGDRSPDALARLNQRIETGPFEIHLAHTFRFEDMADAHRALAKHYVGKVVARVSES